jgi:hypothetical protein
LVCGKYDLESDFFPNIKQHDLENILKHN